MLLSTAIGELKLLFTLDYSKARRNDIEVRHLGDWVRHVPTEQYDLAVIAITCPAHARDQAIRHQATDERPITRLLAAADRALAGKVRRKVRNIPELADEEGVPGARDEEPFTPLVMSSGGLIDGDMKQKMRECKGWGMSQPIWSWMTMSIAVRIATA